MINKVYFSKNNIDQNYTLRTECPCSPRKPTSPMSPGPPYNTIIVRTLLKIHLSKQINATQLQQVTLSPCNPTAPDWPFGPDGPYHKKYIIVSNGKWWLLGTTKKAFDNWLINRFTDRPTSWLAGYWLTNRLTDSDWLTDWLADWLSDWLTHWLTEKQIDWLSDWLSAWLTACLTHWLINWLSD